MSLGDIAASIAAEKTCAVSPTLHSTFVGASAAGSLFAPRLRLEAPGDVRLMPRPGEGVVAEWPGTGVTLVGAPSGDAAVSAEPHPLFARFPDLKSEGAHAWPLRAVA